MYLKPLKHEVRFQEKVWENYARKQLSQIHNCEIWKVQLDHAMYNAHYCVFRTLYTEKERGVGFNSIMEDTHKRDKDILCGKYFLSWEHIKSKCRQHLK